MGDALKSATPTIQQVGRAGLNYAVCVLHFVPLMDGYSSIGIDMRYYVKSVKQDADHGGSVEVELQSTQPIDPESIYDGRVTIRIGSWEGNPFSVDEIYNIEFVKVTDMVTK